MAVLFDTDAGAVPPPQPARDRPVPAAVLDAQLRRMPDVAAQLAAEGWDLVEAAGERERPSPRTRRAAGGRGDRQRARPASSSSCCRSPGSAGATTRPAGWLVGGARRGRGGFAGIALMDHLIQIPQVGRAWEPIPEPWVTLGLLAGLRHRPAARHAGHPGDVPRARACWPRRRRRSTRSAADARSAASGPAGGNASTPASGCRSRRPRERLDHAGDGDRDDAGAVGARHQGLRRRRVGLPETTCYPRPVGAGPDHRRRPRRTRTLRIAARLGRRLQPAVRIWRCWTASSRCCARTASGRPGSGRGRGHRARRAGRRPRPGARRRNWSSGCGAGPAPPRSRGAPRRTSRPITSAGTASWPSAGSSTVFVALPDLADPTT